MKTIFSTWSELSQHAGAMLMAPSVLAIAVVAFSFFSWNRQMVEDAPLLDQSMQVRIDLEHINRLLYELDSGVRKLHSIRNDAAELDRLHSAVVLRVDDYFSSMNQLQQGIAALRKGSNRLGEFVLSELNVTAISDEALLHNIEVLEGAVDVLSSHLQAELEGAAYQTFAYSEIDGELIGEAINSANVADQRVHTLIKERFDLQGRLFLLLMLVFLLLSVWLFARWRRLKVAQEASLADLYLTSQATEQSRLPIMILSDSGVIEFANQQFLAITHLEPEKVIGCSIEQLIEASEPLSDALLAAAAGQGHWRGVVKVANGAGEALSCDAMLSPILDRALQPSFFQLDLQISH